VGVIRVESQNLQQGQYQRLLGGLFGGAVLTNFLDVINVLGDFGYELVHVFSL
jgi:hypothetical protein